MRTELVAEALLTAQRERGSLVGAIFGSDLDPQYTSKAYAQRCADLGVTLPMGAVGPSADNALAESFNATLKRETLKGAPRWATAPDARLAVFRWVARYNTRRRHSYCGQLSSVAYEQAHHAATVQPAA